MDDLDVTLFTLVFRVNPRLGINISHASASLASKLIMSMGKGSTKPGIYLALADHKLKKCNIQVIYDLAAELRPASRPS